MYFQLPADLENTHSRDQVLVILIPFWTALKSIFLWMLNFPIYCPVSVMLDKRSKVSGRMRHRSYRIHRSCRLHREDTVVQIPTGLPQPFVRLERGVQSNGCLHTAVKLLCRKRLYVYAGTTENLTVIQS